MQHTTSKASDRQRILEIDGVINFRDLGGYRGIDGGEVAWGKVYRSAQLDRLSQQGVQAMAELDIRVVVDLRFGDETARYPTIRAAVPNAEIIAWQDLQQQQDLHAPNTIQRAWKDSLASNDPDQVREAMRSNYPKKLYSHREIYRQMLLRLIDDKTPLVFHCAAGKDRTGVAAALILSLLGVDNQQIIEDYLITRHAVGELMEVWHAGGATGNAEYQDFQNHLTQHPRELIQPVFDADQAYINTLLDYVEDTYQGFENYALTKLRLSRDQITALQIRLLV